MIGDDADICGSNVFLDTRGEDERLDTPNLCLTPLEDADDAGCGSTGEPAAGRPILKGYSGVKSGKSTGTQQPPGDRQQRAPCCTQRTLLNASSGAIQKLCNPDWNAMRCKTRNTREKDAKKRKSTQRRNCCFRKRKKFTVEFIPCFGTVYA